MDKSGSPFGEPPLRWRGEGSIAMIILMCAAMAGTSGTLAGASFTVGTADALHSAPLFLPDVPNCEADNQCNNRNYDDVIHKTAPLRNLLLQCVLSSQRLIGLIDQGNDHGHDGGNHDQTGQEAFTDRAGGYQGADLIDQESDGVTGGELESHTAPEPLA